MARDGKGEKRSGDMPGQPSHGQRRRRWMVAIPALLVAAAAVVYVGYQATASPPGIEMPDQGDLHIQTEREPHVAYNSDPPTSGPHLPYLAPWGIHTTPIAKELQVHNLEDGGVAVQYHCPQGCPELVEKLRAIVASYRDKVLLAPYPGMKTRIALTAWRRIDAFDDFDEGRIQRFIRAYRGIDHHRG